jgi:hypothetical protein
MPPDASAPLPPLRGLPIVTIVTPCLNPGERLELAVRSIREQTYPHIEHIIVDGGSSDGTAERLDALESPGVRVIREPDNGQSDALNKGFERANGEILTWLNADDVLVPDAVETWVDLLSHGSNPALCYGGCYEWFESSGWMAPAPWVRSPDYRVLRDRSDYIMQPAAAFRADAFRRVGGLDPALHYTMDWDLWLALSRRWPVAHSQACIAANRVHPDTKTSNGGIDRIREIRAVGRRHGRSALASANHRYGIVELSQRSAAVGWLRHHYKGMRYRLANRSAEPSRLARVPHRYTTALPLNRPHSLWGIAHGDDDQLVLELRGRRPDRYTVSVDGAHTRLRADGSRHIGRVKAVGSLIRRVDLPVCAGAALTRMTFARDGENVR